MIDVTIIYENKDIIVLNKPAGMLTHPDGRSEEKTLAHSIASKWPRLLDVGEAQFDQKGKKLLRPGIVHRLDRETSGLIMAAKNQRTFEFLKKQFQEREIEKEYGAICYGKMKKERGEIIAPIGRSIKTGFFSAVRPSKKIRQAQTQYEVIKKISQYSYLKIMPKTGRTHQIRVHLKSIGHPIVCDSLYGRGRECPVAGLSRLALHAWKISVTLPDGRRKTFEAPMPQDMRKALEKLSLL